MISFSGISVMTVMSNEIVLRKALSISHSLPTEDNFILRKILRHEFASAYYLINKSCVVSSTRILLFSHHMYLSQCLRSVEEETTNHEGYLTIFKVGKPVRKKVDHLSVRNGSTKRHGCANLQPFGNCRKT